MAKATDSRSIILAVGARIESPNPFESGDAVFAPKILASASLPYKQPRPNQLTDGCWVRSNGDYTLIVQGLQQGIPYGMYPRLFLIWLCDEVHRTGNRIVTTGTSFWEFARKLNVDTSRGKRGPGRMMIEQIERTLDARFAFSMRREGDNQLRSSRDYLTVADHSDLFWDDRAPDQPSLFESTITLTDKFFKEITENYVPQDMRAINAIRARKSPLELDVLLWLTYRMYCLQRGNQSAIVTWPQLYLQFGCGFSRTRDFRAAFLEALKGVCSIYTDAKVNADEQGLFLSPSKPLVPAKYHSAGHSGRLI